MADTTVSIRIDEDTKQKFEKFCSDVGINMSVAVNMFIRASLREQKIPFELVSEREKALKSALESIKAIQKESVKSGLSEMTMEEIDAEIALARIERKERKERESDAKNSD